MKKSVDEKIEDVLNINTELVKAEEEYHQVVEVVKGKDITGLERDDDFNTARENIARLGSDHYMTMMALRLNETQMTVAGKHQDIIIYRSSTNKTEVICTNGTWLGITDNIENYLTDVTEKIDDGDIVLLFTDGITEATDKNGEMFGQERLEQSLNQYADFPVNKLRDKIVEEVNDFQEEQFDDMTLVVIKKCPPNC